jgi:hypothetical protein
MSDGMAELENATGTPSLTKAEAEDLWSLAGSGRRCECGAVLQGLIGPRGHRGVTARRKK